VVIRGYDGGRLGREHRRAVHRAVRRDDVAGELSDGGDIGRNGEQARLRGLVGRLAALEDAADDRAPHVVLATHRVGDVRILEHARKVDLLDRDRRVAFLGPHFRRAAPMPDNARVLGEHGEQALQRGKRDFTGEGELEDVAIVQPPGGLAERTAVAPGHRDAGHEQRIGGHAEGEDVPAAGLDDGIPQALERAPQRGMVGRI